MKQYKSLSKSSLPCSLENGKIEKIIVICCKKCSSCKVKIDSAGKNKLKFHCDNCGYETIEGSLDYDRK